MGLGSALEEAGASAVIWSHVLWVTRVHGEGNKGPSGSKAMDATLRTGFLQGIEDTWLLNLL